MRSAMAGDPTGGESPYPAVLMDECVLAERLITYDTATGEGLRAAAGFVKGWLESRELTVDGREHDGLPVILAEVGRRARRPSCCTVTSTSSPHAKASSRRASRAIG